MCDKKSFVKINSILINPDYKKYRELMDLSDKARLEAIHQNKIADELANEAQKYKTWE